MRRIVSPEGKRLLSAAVFAMTILAAAFGEGPQFREPAFSWSGSWEKGGKYTDRSDFRLHVLKPTLLLRFQALGKRNLKSLPAGEKIHDTAALSAGIYHELTGSRLLYGFIDEGGLPARIRNPWIRGIPLPEYHKPSISDLKNEFSSTKKPEAYFYLASPPKENIRGFASVLADGDLNPSLTTGMDFRFRNKSNLGLEFFYTNMTLPPRTAPAWFSEKPPLPERDFRLYAGAFTFSHPFFTAAGDGAFSQTFAYGRGFYGNLALGIGNRPWQFSLAADAAGDRFVDREGRATGAGFRLAGRLEWKGKKSRLFRLSTSLRSGGLGENFNRSSSLIYYRFPASRSFWSFTRVSFGFDRNASDLKKILDSLDARTGFKLGPVNANINGSLTGRALTGEKPFPYPGAADSYSFYSAKISGDLSYTWNIFQFKTKLGYAKTHNKEPVWDTSCSVSLRKKPVRFTVKIASPDFPRLWTYTLSWRLDL